MFENWHKGANHINGAAGAFFTPWQLAADFSLDVGGRRIIDLCAGIGILSYFAAHRGGRSELPEITLFEINPRYYEVCRKLVPKARWINADVFDRRAEPWPF